MCAMSKLETKVMQVNGEEWKKPVGIIFKPLKDVAKTYCVEGKGCFPSTFSSHFSACT